MSMRITLQKLLIYPLKAHLNDNPFLAVTNT